MTDKATTHNAERFDLNKEGERRIGFLAGQAKIPDDINKYDDEILRMFGFSKEEIAEEMKNRKFTNTH